MKAKFIHTTLNEVRQLQNIFTVEVESRGNIAHNTKYYLDYDGKLSCLNYTKELEKCLDEGDNPYVILHVLNTPEQLSIKVVRNRDQRKPKWLKRLKVSIVDKDSPFPDIYPPKLEVKFSTFLLFIDRLDAFTFEGGGLAKLFKPYKYNSRGNKRKRRRKRKGSNLTK